MKRKFDETGIYAVITEKFCRNGSSLDTLREVLEAGVKIVQLREKEIKRSRFLKLAREYRKLTKRHRAIFIVNDRPDIAALAKADGVHLGQDDADVKKMSQKYPGLIIGVSTHNIREAKRAISQGADYINIGPIFTTKTKDTGRYKAIGCGKLKKIASGITVPFTVMGGIKAHNIGKVSQAEAKIFAMITEITMAKNIGKRIQEINKIINNNVKL